MGLYYTTRFGRACVIERDNSKIYRNTPAQQQQRALISQANKLLSNEDWNKYFHTYATQNNITARQAVFNYLKST